jgi:hypothetical protein
MMAWMAWTAACVWFLSKEESISIFILRTLPVCCVVELFLDTRRNP